MREAAYLQIEIDEESRKLLVINTHKGLFHYNILCFGLSPVPALFQKLVDYMVAGITGVATYQNDIIVTGRTTEDHLSNLRRVLSALDDYGLKLQPNKCAFVEKEVSYLGHIISKDGLLTSGERVEAIAKYPLLEDVKNMRVSLDK